METAVEATKRGAADYLPKPFTPAQVRLVAHKVAERRALETQVETLQERLQGATPDVRLESQSPAMQQVFGPARQVAGGDTTVLIQGESGTGKGVLAHTNAPGSRHKKRYEDVLDLLDAGIHVITTLNVQHLESRYDLGDGNETE